MQTVLVASLKESQENLRLNLVQSQATITDLLNRLQTHSWTEYAGLNQVLNPSPVEYVSPDSFYEKQVTDEFGDFEPLVDLTSVANFQEVLASLGTNDDV